MSEKRREGAQGRERKMIPKTCSLQFLKTDYGVVCEVLEPAVSAKAKVHSPNK